MTEGYFSPQRHKKHPELNQKHGFLNADFLSILLNLNEFSSVEKFNFSSLNPKKLMQFSF